MDAELAAILQNIKSLADQATQMQSGSEATEGTPEVTQGLDPEIAEKVLKYLKDMSSEEKKEDEIEKSDDEDKDGVKKSAEGTTADDKAEARIDETTDVNDENIKEVAKAIMKIVGKSKGSKEVKKSVDNFGVKELTSVVKSLLEEVKVQKEFNTNILKGLGIADEILASSKVEEKSKAVPAVGDPNEVAKSLAYIQSILGLKPEDSNSVKPGTNGKDHVIQKSLSANDGEALKLMFSKNVRK